MTQKTVMKLIIGGRGVHYYCHICDAYFYGYAIFMGRHLAIEHAKLYHDIENAIVKIVKE